VNKLSPMCKFIMDPSSLKIRHVPQISLSTPKYVEIWVASRAILLEWCQPGVENLVRDQEVDEYHQHENLFCKKYEKTS
jgi:hypothetical protein